MDIPTTEQLIQGGAVGIALALVYLIYYMTKTFMKYIGNHNEHQTDAIKDLTVAITTLTNWLTINR